MAHIMWNGVSRSVAGQGLDFTTGSLVMGSAGATITVSPTDLVAMLGLCLDTQSNGDDKYGKARNALGISAGAGSYSGHTAAITTGRGCVLTHTASGATLDVGNSHSFAVAVASLCQSALPDTAGQLMRMK